MSSSLTQAHGQPNGGVALGGADLEHAFGLQTNDQVVQILPVRRADVGLQLARLNQTWQKNLNLGVTHRTALSHQSQGQ